MTVSTEGQGRTHGGIEQDWFGKSQGVPDILMYYVMCQSHLALLAGKNGVGRGHTPPSLALF